MIVGIGIDILKISRIRVEHAKRVLSDEEFIIFNEFKLEARKLEYLAGRFAAKEAIIKAIGHTTYVVGMRDIAILNDDNGLPYVFKPVYDDIRISISLSHEKDNSIGMCVIENV